MEILHINSNSCQAGTLEPKYINNGFSLVTTSCLTLCDPLDGSPPGSTVHGISQVRILEWVAIPFSRGIFLTQGSNLHLFHLLHWLADSLSLVPPGKACDSVKRKQTVAQHDGPL